MTAARMSASTWMLGNQFLSMSWLMAFIDVIFSMPKTPTNAMSPRTMRNALSSLVLIFRSEMVFILC